MARPLRSLVAIGSVQAVGYLAALGWHLLLARSVDPSLYGLIAFALAVILAMQVLFASGYPAALIRFIPVFTAEGHKAELQGLRRRAVGVTLGGGIAALALALLLHLRGSGFTSAGLELSQWILIIATGFFSALLNLGTALLIGLRRPAASSFVGGALLHLMLLPALALGIHFGRGDADGLLMILLLVHAGAGIASALLIWKPGAGPGQKLDGDVARFARRSLAIGLVALGLSYMDRLMIGWLGDFEQVALYNIPARFARLLYVLVYLLNPLMGPLYSRHLNLGSHARALRGYRSASMLMAMLATPLALTLIFHARAILGLAAGASYAEGAAILVLLTLGALVVTWMGNSSLFIQMGGRERSELSMSLVALGVNFTLNIVLIPRFGALGAAWATLTSLLLSSLGRGIIAWRRWRALPGVLGSARMPLALTAFLAVHLLTRNLSWPLSLALSLAAYLATFGMASILRELRSLETALDDAPYRPRLAIVVAPAMALSRAYDGQWRRFVESGFAVTAIAPPGEDDHAFARAEGAATRSIPMARTASPPRDLVSLLRLIFRLLGIRPDLMQFSTPKASLLGALAGLLAGVPERIYLVRGRAYENFHGPRLAFYRIIERITCRAATVVVPVSAALGEALVTEGLCPRGKIRLLGAGSSAGVDLAAFEVTDARATGAAKLREELGLSAEDVAVLFAGWIRQEKGVEDLLRAFPSCGSRLHLLLVGDFYAGDPIDSALRRLVEENPRIHLLGWREDLAPVYAAADILVHPSLREGFPRVLLEAAAASLPAIATDWPGAREALVDGETGLVVPRSDSAALANALMKLANDPALRNKMGVAARARVERDFAREKVWNLHLELMRELLERHR